MRGVVVLEAAEEEIEEAADYLDEETPGLGDEFLAEVQRTIGRLRLNPYGPEDRAEGAQDRSQAILV